MLKGALLSEKSKSKTKQKKKTKEMLKGILLPGKKKKAEMKWHKTLSKVIDKQNQKTAAPSEQGVKQLQQKG